MPGHRAGFACDVKTDCQLAASELRCVDVGQTDGIAPCGFTGSDGDGRFAVERDWPIRTRQQRRAAHLDSGENTVEGNGHSAERIRTGAAAFENPRYQAVRSAGTTDRAHRYAGVGKAKLRFGCAEALPLG